MQRPSDIFQNVEKNVSIPSLSSKIYLLIKVLYNGRQRVQCAARCVHLSLQEEDCTSSSYGDSKIYTSGSTTNSQRILTEINESGVCGK